MKDDESYTIVLFYRCHISDDVCSPTAVCVLVGCECICLSACVRLRIRDSGGALPGSRCV